MGTHGKEKNQSFATPQQGQMEKTHLLIAVHEIHEAVMVVVVVRALGCIDGQQQVVGAQAVALCVSVAEDTCLQQLVIRVSNAYKCKHSISITNIIQRCL